MSDASSETIFTHKLREKIPNQNGDLVDEISFRKPRGGDILRCGNPVKYMPHDEEQEITFDEVKMGKMIAALSSIPLAMLDRMDPQDMVEISWGVARFFIPGLGRAKP